jgi:AcrR family transcriptional regulator
MRADAQRNRERLLDASIELVLEVGGEPTRDAIAQRAGVGIATLYRHFPDRQSLLYSIAVRVLDRNNAAGDEVLAEAANSLDALRRYLHAAIDNGVGVLNIIYPLIESPEWPEQRAKAQSILSTMLTRAVVQGRIREDTSMTDVAFAIIRFCRPLAVGLPPDDERAIAHRHVDTYVDGLRADARADEHN